MKFIFHQQWPTSGWEFQGKRVCRPYWPRIFQSRNSVSWNDYSLSTDDGHTSGCADSFGKEEKTPKENSAEDGWYRYVALHCVEEWLGSTHRSMYSVSDTFSTKISHSHSAISGLPSSVDSPRRFVNSECEILCSNLCWNHDWFLLRGSSKRSWNIFRPFTIQFSYRFITSFIHRCLYWRLEYSTKWVKPNSRFATSDRVLNSSPETLLQDVNDYHSIRYPKLYTPGHLNLLFNKVGLLFEKWTASSQIVDQSKGLKGEIPLYHAGLWISGGIPKERGSRGGHIICTIFHTIRWVSCFSQTSYSPPAAF